VDWWTGRDERQSVSTGMGMGSAMPNPTVGLRRSETLPSGLARYERALGGAATLYGGLGPSRPRRPPIRRSIDSSAP
jgi:hypothetical protein